jgi:hypothetical protein
VRPLKGYIHPGKHYNLESETLIASTDHMSIVFNLPQKHWEKPPMWGKERSKQAGPKSKPKEPNPKCITKGPGTIMFQSPPQSQEVHQKKKGVILFSCFIAKVEQSHTLQDVT